jgi:hypothetical protein
MKDKVLRKHLGFTEKEDFKGNLFYPSVTQYCTMIKDIYQRIQSLEKYLGVYYKAEDKPLRRHEKRSEL